MTASTTSTRNTVESQGLRSNSPVLCSAAAGVFCSSFAIPVLQSFSRRLPSAAAQVRFLFRRCRIFLQAGSGVVSENLAQRLLGGADGARQQNLGDVVGVKTADVLLIRRGQSFLRLDHFNVVGDAGGETVLGLGKRLLRIVQGGPGHLDLLAGGGYVENGVGDILLDAAFEIIALRLALRRTASA